MKNLIIGNMADRVKSILGLMVLAALIATIYIVGSTDAADVTWTTNVGAGATYRAKAVDLGDYHAPAFYEANHEYYSVSPFVPLLAGGAVTTRFIIAPLDAGTSGYQHGDSNSYLVVRDYDFSAVLDSTTAVWFYSLGVVTSQNGATEGTAQFFYHAIIKGTGVTAARRTALPNNDEQSLELDGSSLKYVIAYNEGLTIGAETIAEYAVGATLGYANGSGAHAVQVGDLVARLWELADGGNLYLTSRVTYRAE